MTQEEKQLLLKDICARLPYRVKVHTWYNKPMDVKCTGVDVYTNTINLDIPNDDDAKVYIENVKPYLRPMSSMTEEEAKETCRLENFENRIICVFPNNHTHHFAVGDAVIDWLIAHHFDFRGLIEKGLALEAPEGIYSI